MQTRSSPNRDTLVRLAQRMGIPDAEKLAKADLFTKLHDQFNFERLLRTELRRSKADTKSTKRARIEDEEEIPVAVAPSEKKARLNRLDPIMFVPVVKRKAFKFSRPNGTIVQFNVDSLIDYLLSSGDFHDPETRLPFSDQDLHEIDKIGKDIGLTKASVYDAKRNVNGYSEAKFRRDALLGLERCAGEVVADMLDIAENIDPDDAQMQLVMREFPVFLDFYRQLKQADPAYAHKCLVHWRIFITGPPNRPNIDDYGLLRIVSNFLRSCEDA